MTLEFLRNFFPDLSRELLSYLPLTVGVADIFSFTITTCINTEYIIEIAGYQIRNPTLLPIQMLGMIIGLYAAFTLKRNTSWFYAFLFFGCMNLTSIFCHNLSKQYSALWELSRILDIIFTGASSLSLPFLVNHLSHKTHMFLFGLLFAFGIICDYSMVDEYTIPFTAEIIYLLLMIIGSINLALLVLSSKLRFD